MNVDTVLYVISFVLAFLAFAGIDAKGKNLFALAFAIFVLSFLI